MMSSPDDHDDGGKTPRLTPTAIDQVSPFDSTTARRKPAPPRETEPSESDPPTSIVSRDGFRELPPGTVVGDNYEIDAKLGAGAMGEVYAARHLGLGKRVAIKVIGRRLSEDAAAIERFAMEAKTLAQIQHPAIVAVEHVGELADGRAYFVMEYLRGESLFERLARGRVPLPEALRILDQMARGLDAAHGEGVTHRDLKPENTFLVHLPGEDPAVKLLDFGLAKLRPTDDLRAERTESGVAIGTPMYMSPEQARGPDVDHRTDIYALGIVAYELVLGQAPFPHARTAPEFWAAHLAEAPPLPRSIWPEIPPQLDLVLFAMVAKNPSHRPTLAQVRAVIAAVRVDAPQRLQTEFVGRRHATPRMWPVAIGILALIVGIAVGSMVSRTAGPRAEAPRDVAPQVVTPMPPPVQILAPTAPLKEIPAPPPPKSHGGSASHTPTGSAAARSQKTGSAAIAPTAPPLDAEPDTVEAPHDQPAPKPKTPWTDRNQTINPFVKHKVYP